MSAHRKAAPVAVGRHRPAAGRVPVGRVPREMRHHGGGHRAEIGCFGSLLVAVFVGLAALFVDTH